MASFDDQKYSDAPETKLNNFLELLADLQIIDLSGPLSLSVEEERAKRKAEIEQLEREILAPKPQPLPEVNLSNNTNNSVAVSPKNKPLQQKQKEYLPKDNPSLNISNRTNSPEEDQFSFDNKPIKEQKTEVSVSNEPLTQENNPPYHSIDKNNNITQLPSQDIFSEQKKENNLSQFNENLGVNLVENNPIINNLNYNLISQNLGQDETRGIGERNQELPMEITPDEAVLNYPQKNEQKFTSLSTAKSQKTLVNLPQENKPKDGDEKLQSLLTQMLLPDSQKQMGSLEQKIDVLQNQINNPEQLMELLLPLVTELLSLKVSESKDDMVKVIVPIIDEIIKEKSYQDKEAMIAVMANIIPGAISKQIADKPQEVIQAIAPAMGESIKEQIRLEKDAMVDALYPVIGNTISKYMGEVIKQINSKVESALSVEGIKRKIRAKMQGVSEAELILQESMPFKIQAIFLIHKASGLVMSEAQPMGKEKLEGDMLAGMLTAIRSFANDCSINPENTSELTEIEYEKSKIMMEVAGYCYLAVIIEGEVTKEFIKKLKDTLGIIILNYGYSNFIKEYNGDEEVIPQTIHDLLDTLLNYREIKDDKKSAPPVTLLIIIASLLALISIPLGMFWYRQRVETRWVNEAKLALSSTPEIAVYRLDVEVNDNTVILKGKLPNESLKEKAKQVTEETLPKLTIENEIVAVDVPPDPILIKAEVERLTNLFNGRESVIISTVYQNNEVTVKGNIRNENEAQQISKSFASIPGIKNVFITLIPQPFPIDQRFYFNYDSAELNTQDITKEIKKISEFLNTYPQIKIRIVGHTDPTGTEIRNKQLAQERAIAIKNLLLAQGINPAQLTTVGIQQPPDDIYPYSPLWLGRCVRFERIM
jgi:outer membrane protein OmpA-like peptidoglycan-associated protein